MPQKKSTTAIRPPVIILHQTQLGENIGMSARAMLNCGFEQLRLVAPRGGWPDPAALAPAADADPILEAARCFDTLEAAIADCHHLYAATARPRAGQIPLMPVSEAIGEIRRNSTGGAQRQTAVLFGPEASGLDNDSLSHADGLVHFPMNPDFNSLNLAQAVLLFGWEWLRLDAQPPGQAIRETLPSTPAAKQDLATFLDRLEQELGTRGFFLTPALRPDTARKLRTFFTRATPSDQELRMLHGVITALMKNR